MLNNKSLINSSENPSQTSQKNGFTWPQMPGLNWTFLKVLLAKISLRKKTFLEPHQEIQLKLTEIGAYLQKIRLEKGLSVEAIAQQTCIPVRLLIAIETGNLELLPEPIYVRGFIKQFAEALGLNGTEIANPFPTELKSKQNKSRFRFYLPSFHVRPFHLYLFYILLVMVSVKGISNILKQSTVESEITPIPSQPIIVPSPMQKFSPSTIKRQ